MTNWAIQCEKQEILQEDPIVQVLTGTSVLC